MENHYHVDRGRVNFEIGMTPTEKLNRVSKLCHELQDEENDIIVQSRLEGLAKELKVSAYQCGLMFWALKNGDEFKTIFGSNMKIKFRAKG